MELPKVEYQTGSQFLLSLSILSLFIVLISSGIYYYKLSELPPFTLSIIFVFVVIIGVSSIFVVSFYYGIKLLRSEDISRRIKNGIERDLLLREYWIRCIEYNEKAKNYNKKYDTPVFPEKGALEFSTFLKESDPNYIKKLK